MFDTNTPVLLCIVDGRNIWLPNGRLPEVPYFMLSTYCSDWLKVGEFEGKPIYYGISPLIEITEWGELRELLSLPDALFSFIGKAVQYQYMVNTLRFCSFCGNKNRLVKIPVSMCCQTCQKTHYPVVSPCVIVAVKRENTLLLAKHKRHKSEMYTVLAGFVEPGETLESCVKREVFEETQIQIDQLRYLGSQPWAFPSNLMVAFIADYLSGEIIIDDTELDDANWFSVSNLPSIPPHGTIARFLIEKVKNETK